jgi:DNA invertase Pin-like site-specific DNA recombinase
MRTRAAENLRGLRVAVYARFSSTNQREASIEDQLRRCTEFVEARGGTVRPEWTFVDRAMSGASLKRPGFEQLHALARAKGIDAIVTEDTSRISREFADAAILFRELAYLEIALLGVPTESTRARRTQS